jgi:formylglycine-generating enzyme required for sulfatase activity
VDEVQKIDLEFALIRAGRFTMGDPARPDEAPLHEVAIPRDFWMQVTPVTQAQWEAVLQGKPSYFKGPTLPVEMVSWQDAHRFLAALNRRLKERKASLPTEAQWEYACRAGTRGRWSFGDEAGRAGEFAWTVENSEGSTRPVAGKKPNAWGLFDMHGNVWEWCEDAFGPYGRDASEPAEGAARVIRGGSWGYDVHACGSGSRKSMRPDRKTNAVGFRVVLG